MAKYDVDWSGTLSSTVGTVAIGDALVLDSAGFYRVATSANRTTYGRSVGIATTAGDASNPTVEVVVTGMLASSVTGLGAGTVSWVRVDANGRLERCNPAVGDDVIGKVRADGALQVAPGTWDSANVAGGGDTPPTGDGIVTVTSGAFDGSALTVGTGVATWITTPSGANLASALTSALPYSKGGTGLTTLGTAGQVIAAGVSSLEWATPVTPAGSLTELQYRASATTLGAVSKMTWDASNTRVNLASAGLAIHQGGAPDYYYVLYGGALSANRDLYLPAISTNDTLVSVTSTASFTNKTFNIGVNTLTHGSAATGDIVAWDGSRYNRLATASGVLTFLGTPSSANLASAVTDETGSGALVFGTSPTFTTKIDVNGPANQFVSAGGGWADMLGRAVARTTGATVATFEQVTGDFYANKFDIGDEMWFELHPGHDLAATTIHFHAHWFADGTDANAVKWQFDYVYSAGYGRGEFAFTSPTTDYATTTPGGSTAQYRHFISETPAQTLANLETDAVILVHLKRITNGATDNTDKIFLVFCDAHYKSNGAVTANRNYPFS